MQSSVVSLAFVAIHLTHSRSLAPKICELIYPRALELVGSSLVQGQALQSLIDLFSALVAAAIIAVYAILAMLYESYIYPLAILSTLPSAGVGALLALNGAAVLLLGPFAGGLMAMCRDAIVRALAT